MSKTLYLIDGFAQIFRAYYAIRNGMQSPVTGEPTHAVFGFTGMLLKLFNELKPDYVVVAVDAPGKTFRDEMYSEYKATRDETPADLTAQIPRVFELVEGFGVPVIGKEGLEADDVIATITEKVLNDPNCQDVRIRIVSRDKDLEQLIGERVTLYDIHKDEEIDEATLWEKRGVKPHQVIDLLALVGDTADNVPGVPGIGPKTAAKLVQEYGGIDGLLENIDEIKGKRRENLEAAKETLPLARTLVTLKRDGDVPFDLESAKTGRIDVQKLLSLFQQLGFRRYQDEVRKLAQAIHGEGIDLALPEAAGAEGMAASAGQAETAQTEPEKKAVRGEYEVITTEAQLDEVVQTLARQEVIAFDTETTDLSREASLCGLSFSWQEGHGVYVPTRSPDPDSHLDTETVLGKLRDVLEDPKIGKCGHNVKFDAGVLLEHGVRLKGVIFDTMLASILIDPGKAGHKLDQLAEEHLGYTMTPITDLIGNADDEQLSMEVVPLEAVAPYAAEDADVAFRLYKTLAPKTEALNLDRLMKEIEAPLTVVLAQMEQNGILCEPEELARQGEELQKRVDELRESIVEIVGEPFNLDSPKQLAEVLFDKLGLTPVKKTKTGYSTDIEVLTKLAADEDKNDPRTLVPGLIIEYRQLSKLISTYLGNLRDAVDPKTGRIHSTFHQLVAATGRLASQNPNLQNIPIRSDVGRQIRKAFKAPEDHLLICADYSQVELRMLAHLSGDEGLKEAFANDLDIHAAVAAQVFQKDLEDVDETLRNYAKVINFGIIYGITPYGLARRVEGISVAQAGDLIADYKRRFPGIDAFLSRCINDALEYGYVKTIMGRRRWIPEISSRNRAKRSLGERLAINSVVQGSAADLIKLAMVNVQNRIDKENLPAKLLLQIHDELVLEAPRAEAEACAHVVQTEMEQAMQLDVPLKAEVGIGADWYSAQ